MKVVIMAVAVVVMAVAVAPQERVESHPRDAGWLRQFDEGGQRPSTAGSDLDISIHCHGRSGLGPALLLAGSATASLSEALLTLVCAQNVCWGSFTCRLAPSTTSGLRSRTSGSTTARVFFSITEEKRPVKSSCQRVYRTFSPTASVPSRSTTCWQRRRSLCGLRSCTATLETGSPG